MSVYMEEAVVFFTKNEKESLMNKHIIHIKNMVCPRCITTVKNIAEELEMQPIETKLGYVETAVGATFSQLAEFKQRLEAVGFELLTERHSQIAEDIKLAVIRHFYGESRKPTYLNFSDWLSKEINVSYSHLSSVFSEQTGMTIEHYIIAQRIERAKELLSYGTKSMSQISDELEYRSPQHFSGQFKQVTGMSPSEYKKSGSENRRGVDDVF